MCDPPPKGGGKLLKEAVSIVRVLCPPTVQSVMKRNADLNIRLGTTLAV
jgi:hypothetical protein